jgi:formate dehydrogenase major subunit
VHQVCIPWHWGPGRTSEQGVAGDPANDLILLSGDPNVSIQESKAFRCDVRAGRREGETTRKLAGAHGAPDPDPENPEKVAQVKR